MFANVSNHPSSKWAKEQILAAQDLGACPDIFDVPFPNVPPDATSEEVYALAQDLFKRIDCLPSENNRPMVVLVQGEMTFTYALVRVLLEGGPYWPVAATTERVVVEDPNTGTKTSVFKFVRFRRYEW